MPVIMCTRNLWRAIGGSGALAPRYADDPQDTRLGAWCANVACFPEGCFVVALNEVTYTAIVFPLLPPPEFILPFSLAVGIQLAEAGIPPDMIQREVEPFHKNVVFRKNSNRSLLGSLNDVCWHVGLMLEDAGRSDPDTVFEIQRDLNEMPHVDTHPGGPNTSLRLLFAEAARA